MSVQDKAKVPPVATIQSVPRTVVALGFVSLFMDLSSEIIHSLLPVFLVTVLGAGNVPVEIFVPNVTPTAAGTMKDGFGTAQSQIFHNTFPDYSVYLNLQIPLRNRSAQDPRSIRPPRRLFENVGIPPPKA